MVGMVLTGVFATKSVNAAGANGLLYGETTFFLTQLKGLAIVVAYSFTVSFAIFKFINFILPIRVSQEDELLGLDASQHDENYTQGTLLVQNGGTLTETVIED
jgi:Amt family ammonium transporter